RYGVATHSSGNHAQAVARAAKLAGVPAYVVMPTSTPKVKRNGVLFYEGRIVDCEPTLQSREDTLANAGHDTRAHVGHPYDTYGGIDGQGTAGKDLFDEVQHVDYLLVAVGGGGLLSGSLLSAKYFSQRAQGYGAEPHGADDADGSFQS